MASSRVGLLTRTALSLALLSCASGSRKPRFDDIGDKTAVVGSEMMIELRASDPDGDKLVFGYDVPSLPDLARRPKKPTLQQFGDTLAVFRWTPLASDVGTYEFDFTVSDGKTRVHEVISVVVAAAAGNASAPVFRTPSGNGTTLDLGQQRCLKLGIVVDDPDSPEVAIDAAAPVLEGVRVTQELPLTATLDWCPSDAQISAQDRYSIVLRADDHRNAPTMKPFLVVLRKPPRMGCPGTAPGIEHAPPAPQTTRANLRVEAHVTDDIGLKSSPLLYWALTQPAVPIDFSMLQQIEMMRVSGDVRDGSYAAEIPNPVASDSGGTQKTVYYLIVAQDSDDASGDCDHTAQAPASGTFTLAVTAGGSATVGYCMACSDDIQCGGSNLCARVGTGGMSFCLADCEGGQACPMGSSCAAMPVAGTRAQRKQCVPTSGSCDPVPPPPACMDDALEPNDTPTTIGSAAASDLRAGTYNLMLCPAGMAANNDDWFRLNITQETQVTARVDFDARGGAVDLDMKLTDSGGAVVRKSEGTGPSESVAQCIRQPGLYFLEVYGYMRPTTSPYSLTLTRTPGTCCLDDALEPNDDHFQAVNTSSALLSGPFRAMGKVCPDNPDFFAVPVFRGQTLTIDLAFTQTASTQDLDIHVFDKDGVTDLTPCPPVASCMQTNGQGATAPERMTWMAPADGTYFVVVRGYGNASNDYALTITRM